MLKINDYEKTVRTLGKGNHYVSEENEWVGTFKNFTSRFAFGLAIGFSTYIENSDDQFQWAVTILILFAILKCLKIYLALKERSFTGNNNGSGMKDFYAISYLYIEFLEEFTLWFFVSIISVWVASAMKIDRFIYWQWPLIIFLPIVSFLAIYHAFEKRAFCII